MTQNAVHPSPGASRRARARAANAVATPPSIGNSSVARYPPRSHRGRAKRTIGNEVTCRYRSPSRLV